MLAHGPDDAEACYARGFVVEEVGEVGEGDGDPGSADEEEDGGEGVDGGGFAVGPFYEDAEGAWGGGGCFLGEARGEACIGPDQENEGGGGFMCRRGGVGEERFGFC